MYLAAQIFIVTIGYLIGIIAIMILVQGLVYRLTGFSIYNFVYAELLRECGYKTGKHSYKRTNKHKKRYVPKIQVETYQIRK